MRSRKKLANLRPRVLVTASTAAMPLDLIERQLLRLGVRQPLGVAESRVPTIKDWMNKNVARQSRNPGKALQLALGELFLANLDDPNQTLWGWADHRNTDLLDFLLEFDDQIHFLLVIESPSSMLAGSALSGEIISQETREELLENWRDSAWELLRFHRDHPDRSLLTNSLGWQFDSEATIERLSGWPKLPYECGDYSESDEASLANQARLILAELERVSCREIAEVDQVWQEVLALSPSPDDATLARKIPAVGVAFVDRALSLTAAHVKLSEEHKAQEKELIAARDESRSLQQSHAISNRELTDLKEENELLLAQLHQVQEELEVYYLKHKDTEDRLADADKELRKLRRKLRRASPPEGVLWSYEDVRLVRLVEDPGYESIWMALEGAKFGEQSWAHLEFRVSAANSHPDTFSRQPHYEFPRVVEGEQVFDHWFVESDDNVRGARFELRFNLAEGAMDMTAWGRLSKNDRLKLAGLMLAVPQLLDDLADQGRTPVRGWEPWKKINQEALALLSQLVKK